LYTHPLNTKKGLELYFKSLENGFPDIILQVALDTLPPDSIMIKEVDVNNKPWNKYDAEKLTVKLPVLKKHLTIKGRITPVSSQD
jgi:hypothetical protein